MMRGPLMVHMVYIMISGSRNLALKKRMSLGIFMSGCGLHGVIKRLHVLYGLLKLSSQLLPMHLIVEIGYLGLQLCSIFSRHLFTLLSVPILKVLLEQIRRLHFFMILITGTAMESHRRMQSTTYWNHLLCKGGLLMYSQSSMTSSI